MGDVPDPGGVCSRGICSRGVYLVRYPPMDRMTHASENITLPQTSFAGGNQAPPPTWNPESALANTRELTYLARCGSRGGPGPPLTLGFEAPKLSIFRPYLIFP